MRSAITSSALVALLSLATLVSSAAAGVPWSQQKKVARAEFGQLLSAGQVQRGSVGKWCTKNFGSIESMSAATAHRVHMLLVSSAAGAPQKLAAQADRLMGQLKLQAQTAQASQDLSALYRAAPRMYPKRLLAGVRLLGNDVERVLPRRVPLQLRQRLGVGQVEHLLEHQDADHQPHRLVGPAVLGVEVRGEAALVDQRKRVATVLVRPGPLEASPLRGVHTVLYAEKRSLWRGAAEHGLL
jgi:hypothetical protein